MIFGTAVALAAVAGYGLFSGTHRYAAAGNPYPGALISVAEPVGWFAASLSGALCLGALIYLAMTSRPEPDGLIDAEGFRIHLVAEPVSIAWLVFAGAMAPVQAANDAGVALPELLTGTALFDSIAASETSRGWIVSALCALLVAVTLRFTMRWIGHVVLVIPTVIGVLAPAVTGSAGQGPNHDYTTSAVIVCALAVATLTGLKMVAAMTGAAPSRPVRVVQIVCGVLAVAYGAVLLCLLGSGWVIGSEFGRLGLAAGILLMLACVSDRLAAALAMTLVMAAIAAMAVQIPPRFLTHKFTAWDVFLGYELPPPSVLGLLTDWRFDGFIGTAAIVLAVGYVVGYVQLRRRGDDWPVGRLLAWLIGCAALLFTSSSGVRAYGSCCSRRRPRSCKGSCRRG